jgi:biofilm PGA synthesis protein PgaD
VTPPIIDRADLQTMQNRAVSGVITVVFWTFWVYLWLPLLALAAWALGLQQAYKYMVVLGGYHEVLRLLGIYALVMGVLCGALAAWATYNILRWGGIERRTRNHVPTLDQVARSFRQGPIAAESWRHAQRLYVVHDDAGAIVRVEILAPGTPVPA